MNDGATKADNELFLLEEMADHSPSRLPRRNDRI